LQDKVVIILKFVQDFPRVCIEFNEVKLI